MRNLLLLGFLAVIFSLGLTQNSYATCSDVGDTGTGGNILDCPAPIQLTPLNTFSIPPTTLNGDEVTIPLNGGVSVMGLAPAIDTNAGSDTVTTSGTIMADTTHALRTGPDNNIATDADTVVVNDGTISSPLAAGIFTGPQADMVTINGGNISGGTFGTTTRQGSDMMEVFGGTITGGNLAIQTLSAQDTLRIFGGTIDGGIAMGTGADNLLIAGGTFVNNFINMADNGPNGDFVDFAADVQTGLVDCGPGDNDTIRFTMDVPAPQVPDVASAIASANPAGDAIIINGITYSWTNCEMLQSNINGIVTIVTLSPLFEINDLETDHTVTAEVITQGQPVVGGLVNFSILEGPNSGLTSGPDGFCSPNPDCTTDANGEVSWTYTGTLEAGPGTDTIESSIDDVVVGAAFSNTVEKEWVFPLKDVPTLSEWGLIAMASLLGIVGFMVVRRRQVAA